MNVAKSLLLAILALPVAELAAFVAVAAEIGLLAALVLVVATSFAGLLVLRHAGASQIARMRVTLNGGRLTVTGAEAASRTVLAGILLLVPGFITDALGLLLLVAPFSVLNAVRAGRTRPRPDRVVDLEPDQWRRVPDPKLPRRRHHRRDS
jgi:UPF0716 protein FxsA